MIPIDNLVAIVKSRGLGQSDLARMAGVSRQAVSLWFDVPSGARIGLRGEHAVNLSRGLKLSLDDLTQPLPALRPEDADKARVELLWDGLCPSLLDFAAAVAREEPRALARLVQTYGLYRCAAVAGEVVWDKFPEYKRHIQPQRRAGLERVWSFERSQA